MRWLLPLILALALAICTADFSAVSRRRRMRVALGDASSSDSARRTGRSRDRATAHDVQSVMWQLASFDARTGTLTWFDDVYN